MWQLQTAKQRFSQLVERALNDGPQVVSRRGRAVVVVVSLEEYRRLREGERDFKRFLAEAPDFSVLEIERTPEPARRVEL